jgi:5-methylcytosine-specific restriction enzyme subunit McrC
MLPDESQAGKTQFADLLGDEAKMAKVFEEFLRNFCKRKLAEFSDVGSETLNWDATAPVPGDLEFLPRMHTDITMRSSTRTVVVDAKYYQDALQLHHGTKKAHSENLYQLLAYLRAEEACNPDLVPEGMLIYPVAENSIDTSFVIDGYPVRLFTLNLNQRWEAIEMELLCLFRSKGLGVP